MTITLVCKLSFTTPVLFVYLFLMTIEDIALLCKTHSVRWTGHILKRIFIRDIGGRHDLFYVQGDGTGGAFYLYR